LNGFNGEGPEFNIGQYNASEQSILKYRLSSLKNKLDNYMSNRDMASLVKLFIDQACLLAQKRINSNLSKRDFLKLLAASNVGTALVQRELSALPDEKLQLIESLFGHEKMFVRFIVGEGSQSLNLSDDDNQLLRTRFNEFYDQYLGSQVTGTKRALNAFLISALFGNGLDGIQRSMQGAANQKKLA